MKTRSILNRFPNYLINEINKMYKDVIAKYPENFTTDKRFG